jgi:TonB-dependent receptor
LIHRAIDIQRGNIVANRSNHRSQRPTASAASGMPLRVPAAASALALVLALSGGPVHAQGQPAQQANAAGGAQQPADALPPPEKKAQKSEVLQEVVVTGIRQSLMSAEAIKRLAPQIEDSVSAEDIGALPDRSVAEALERIPGVLIERTDNNRDPARLTDAGGNVFIRGLSWVKSELDGEEIFSANDGREISFEDISPDLLAGINVYKSPTADQIEGGIGGVIDLRTRMPLDSKHNLTAFSADYEYGDMIKKGFPTVNGLWSNYWETGIGRMGVLLSGTYAQEGNRTDSVQLGDYVGQILPTAEGGQPAGATVYVPNDIAWRRLDWKQNRQALDGVFQWQSPNNAWLLTAHAFQTKDNPQNLENTEGASGGEFIGGSPSPGVNGTVPSNEVYTGFSKDGVLTAGTVGIEPVLDTRYEQDHHSTDFFTTSLRWSPNDRFSLSDDLQYEKSHADMVSMTAFTEVGDPQLSNPTATGGIPYNTTLTFNLAGNNPSVLLNQIPNAMSTQGNYWWYAAMDHIEDNDAHQWADRLDGTLKLEDNDWLRAFRFGGRFTDRHATTRESNWNWSLLSASYWWGGKPVTLTQTPGWASSYQPFNDFMRGTVPAVGPGWFPSYQLVRNGTAYACSVLCPTENTAGFGWAPLTNNWSKYTPASGDNPINGINDQAEHTYAGYAEADFHHDHTPFGPMDGNIGVRVVRTIESPANGTLQVPSNSGLPGTPAQCAAAIGAANCQTYDAAYTFEGTGGTFPYNFKSNNYTDALPSFNVRFLLTHDLQWRIAASQSITRPPFADMIPFATVGYSFLQQTFQPAATNAVTGTSGNPELKPTKANNYDTSLEWYFAPSGDLTFDIFYKDIHNYILTGPVATTLNLNGVSQTFPVTMYQNGSHGTLKGFELAYQQFYTFLPSFLQGFGLQGNLTFVDNTGGANTAQNDFDTHQIAGAQAPALPMEGMSRWSYNAAVMYQAHSIEGRLAWNWRERYLLTTSAANLNEPVWMDNYGQLDGEIFYDVTSYLKVGLQATNLLRARTFLDVGPGYPPVVPAYVPLTPRYSWTDTDRTLALAVRLQF